MAISAVKKKRIHNFVVVPLLILVSGFIRSVCINVFTIPYNFAPGGSTGIASMVEYATGFSAGYTYFIVNAPLLIFAFFFIGKSFALKTGGAITVASLGMLLMDNFNFPVYEDGEPILAAVAAGVLGGIALTMMLKIGGSTGGSDIIAVYIQRKFSATNVAWFIYGIDAVIVFVSAFVYMNGLNPVLLSLVEMFCLSMMSDVISTGFKSALKFEIITKNPDELSSEIIHKLGRSVTCVPAKGMYSHDDKNLLICIIRKRQLAEFNKILRKYPDTFAYLMRTSEVIGNGFSSHVVDDTPIIKVKRRKKKGEDVASTDETIAPAPAPVEAVAPAPMVEQTETQTVAETKAEE